MREVRCDDCARRITDQDPPLGVTVKVDEFRSVFLAIVRESIPREGTASFADLCHDCIKKLVLNALRSALRRTPPPQDGPATPGLRSL